MMTESEARKLQQDMKQELNATPRVVFRCAVMLLLITGLAWSGVGDKKPADGNSSSTATPGMSHAESHSKTVFDERRQRHIDLYPDSIVAREAAARRQSEASSDEEHFAYRTK
jgi:hypothetical protein